MDLAGFRRRLNARLGTSLDPAALDDMVNDALDTLSSEADWPWLHTVDQFDTVADQGAYLVPEDWARSLSLTLDGQEVTGMSVRDLDTATTGTAWGIAGRELILAPAPRRPMRVQHRYVRLEPELTADPDLPILPDRFHNIVLDYAFHLAYSTRLDDARRAEDAMARYRAGVRRMARDRASRAGPGAVRLVRDWG